jgi:hypothetical protein
MMFIPHRNHQSVCYAESFTCLYGDDARTSQETPVACYAEGITCLYVDDILSHRKHTYKTPRSVTKTGLLFCRVNYCEER